MDSPDVVSLILILFEMEIFLSRNGTDMSLIISELSCRIETNQVPSLYLFFLDKRTLLVNLTYIFVLTGKTLAAGGFPSCFFNDVSKPCHRQRRSGELLVSLVCLFS